MSNKTKIFAKAALFYGDKVLILRRSDDDDYMPGEPDLPGGEIDQGETVHDGLDRELGEEIGNTISRDRLQLAYTYTSMKENGNYVRLYFIGKLDTDQLTLSPEHDTVWWMSLDEAIEKNNHPTQNKFLRYIKDNQLLA